MRVAVVGGGPAGLYFALLLKKARPGRSTSPSSSATGADDTFGWGVVFSDQTLENFRAADRGHLRADHRQLRPLGRHRRPRPRPRHHLERPRLRRHRAARSCSTSCRTRCEELGVDAALPDRGPRRRGTCARSGSPTPISSSPPTASTARCARGTRRTSGPTSTSRTARVHLARHDVALRRLHVLFRRERARRVPGALLPLRRRDLHLHRRVRRGVVASAPASTASI